MSEWDWKRWVVFIVPLALLAIGVGMGLLLHRTFRTRIRTARQLRDDPDINEWLVIFGWSRKVLYFPTILASIVAAAVMFVYQTGRADWVDPYVVGGIWLAVFVVNFLVDEYEMSVKVLLILVLVGVVAFLWLLFLDWLVPFIRWFGHLKVLLSATTYLLLAGMFILAILISWIRGLFYYVAITPNYLNIQIGPTETGEQISREEYSTRVDTGDFLERLLGFGRIVITFSDQRRQPMLLLVGRIGKAARELESIRGKLAVDRLQPSREGDVRYAP